MDGKHRVELSDQQIKPLIISSLRQALQVALTPLKGDAIDQDLVDSIKQVLGIYMSLDEHKLLMQEAAMYELATTNMAQGAAQINPE